MKFLSGHYNVQPFMQEDTGVSDVGASTDVGIATDTQVTPAQEPNVVTPTEPVAPNEYDVDGIGKVTPQQIKEWQLGHMRQSDYTRKTQEIAKSRNENKEAMELFNYVKANPQLAQELFKNNHNAPQQNTYNPMVSQIEDMNLKLASIELDNTINSLKTKYQDFNEIEVLTEADKRGINDLEFVYKALQGDKLPNLRNTLSKQIEQEIVTRLKNNALDTQTIIQGNDKQSNTDFGLSQQEINIASKMGLSPEVYARNKNK